MVGVASGLGDEAQVGQLRQHLPRERDALLRQHERLAAAHALDERGRIVISSSGTTTSCPARRAQAGARRKASA